MLTDPIRTYVRKGQVDFCELPFSNRAGLTPVEVPEDTYQSALDRLVDENARGAGPDSTAPVVAKDASFNPSAFAMAYDPNDPASFPLISGMAQVGQVEGFHVLAACAPENVRALEKLVQKDAGNITVVPSQGVVDVWTEDHGEYLTDGSVVIPPLLAEGTELYTTQALGRMERLYPGQTVEGLTQHNLDDKLGAFPMARFAYHGNVQATESNTGMLGTALASSIPRYKMAVSYVEGGNFMPGTRPDGEPFALVGQDSVAVTRMLLERDHPGERPTDQQVLDVIAKDYGLKPGAVYGVEQPADFHLDMSMSLVGPGKVLLNDSLAAFETQKSWVQDAAEVETLRGEAEFRASMEALSARDLQAAGLEVQRVAAVFPRSSGNDEMNFLNLRQGVNEEGEHFAVLLGGDHAQEARMAETLLGSGIDRVHFLPPELTPQTLDLWGGLKCRTKGVA